MKPTISFAIAVVQLLLAYGCDSHIGSILFASCAGVWATIGVSEALEAMNKSKEPPCKPL